MTAEVEADAAAAAQQDEVMEDAQSDVDAEHEVDELADSKPKKKRRMIKLPDKKYECPQPDCGKSYSRAEHLYRHQLNRMCAPVRRQSVRYICACDVDPLSDQPKQIYRCDFSGCDREFVRADLCARHKERHTAKGSHLQRKDAFLNSQRATVAPSGSTSPNGTHALDASPTDINHALHPKPPASAAYYADMGNAAPHYPSNAETQQHGHVVPDMAHVAVTNGAPLDPQLGAYNTYPGTMNGPQHQYAQQTHLGRRFSFDGSFSGRPASAVNNYGQSTHSMQPPPPMASPPATATGYSQAYHSPTSTHQNFRSPTNYSNLPQLPPFGFPQGYGDPSSNRSGSIMSPGSLASMEQHQVPNSVANSIADFNAIDQMNTGYMMPVFGQDTFHREPSVALDDNLLTMLFNTNGFELSDPSPPMPEPEVEPEPQTNQPLPKVEVDGSKNDLASMPALSSGLDITMRECTVSEGKQRRLLELVNGFHEIEHDEGTRSKADMLAGSPSDADHAMSLHTLKTYLSSYWYHIHQQMPILHRPTFNPDSCPDLLLLAMMCLGAACLERGHPEKQTQNGAELAIFIAYHIRWEVFKDPEFRPTAKLWTFQSMLLLELFEKMFSTISLHERAHIHHATTLTVMRRGSSLIGRSANDSRKEADDPTRTPPGPDGTINTSGQNTPDAHWNRWITAEATRRVAFAAFIIDSTHATLFGHSAIMSPHDLRLPLPCDEALWSATSSAEVQRVEASLAANGFKAVPFLEGLKKTLNHQKVRTNTFGRVILMAGLLNVSWHMNQRDLQVSSLGASNTLGNQVRWRSPLTRAFDFWRKDFDESLSKNDHWLHVCQAKNNETCPLDHRDNVFESRTCLHSLAHMAMHVDVIDCQVFAGADRALGRSVTDSDRAAVQKRMKELWAPSARARDATFYALRFLCEVLIPEEELTTKKRKHPHQPPTFGYNARDDSLLNRPWILYFAALIVWSYGYALDGKISPSNYTLTTRELQIYDMQRYLIRMGGVASPDDLEKQKDRNSCLGMLLLLRERFRQPRWGLLHEASDTLGSCIELLTPGSNKEVVARQG